MDIYFEKVTKLISRAMEDTRGLDAKYPNEEDAKQLADTLNGILDHTTKEVLLATGHKIEPISTELSPEMEKYIALYKKAQETLIEFANKRLMIPKEYL